MSHRIPYTKPSITEHEVALATDAAQNGWGSQCYDYLNQFEKRFGDFLGSAQALATSSCTGALHLGFDALGIGPGAEVIMADINWVATASPLIHLGAKPVFVDVLPDTWCVDPAAVHAAVTPQTRAIVATHLYGNPCRMEEILAIGNQHDIPVIEDAAEALGTRIGDQYAGAMGRFGVFSFHGTKTLTTGEGGMLVTNDQELFEKCGILNRHGQSPKEPKQFWALEAGYKFRMANVQAAIGCAQLDRVGELLARKREIFESYAEILKGLPLRMNPEPEGTVNGYWMPTVVVDEAVSFDRDEVLQALAGRGIDARVFFWPLSKMPPFRSEVNNPIAYGLHERALNLPSYHDMTTAEIKTVCDVLRKYLPA